MMFNPAIQSGIKTSLLTPFGFVSPLILKGSRNRYVERCMGFNRAEIQLKNAGFTTILKFDEWVDLIPIFDYLKTTRLVLDKWTAMLIIFSGEDKTLFGFKNDADAILVKMLL